MYNGCAHTQHEMVQNGTYIKKVGLLGVRRRARIHDGERRGRARRISTQPLAYARGRRFGTTPNTEAGPTARRSILYAIEESFVARESTASGWGTLGKRRKPFRALPYSCTSLSSLTTSLTHLPLPPLRNPLSLPPSNRTPTCPAPPPRLAPKDGQAAPRAAAPQNTLST